MNLCQISKIMILQVIVQIIECQIVSSMGAKSLDSQLTVKLAVFIDDSMKNHLELNLNLNETEGKNLLRVYVRQMEIILQRLAHGSGMLLKLKLQNIFMRSLSKFMVKSSGQMGDIDTSLSEFCLYQARQRRLVFNDNKWDFAIMLTSEDLYSEHEARLLSPNESRATLGISPVGGIKWPDLSCMIVEFGTGFSNDSFSGSRLVGIQQTRGFGSVWTAAHELAHNLGIYHDGHPFNGHCNGTKFIMSSESRIEVMPFEWSPCSARKLDTLVKSQELSWMVSKVDGAESEPFARLPGFEISLEDQCAMFGGISLEPHDVDKTICDTATKCRDSRSGAILSIGLPLEGSRCDANGSSRCLGNSCVASHRHLNYNTNR